jgi:hypothetical protein
MAGYSIGVQMAWTIAGVEAAAAGQDSIEPTHLMIGICSLVKLLTEEVRRKLGMEVKVGKDLEAETMSLVAVLKQNGLDATALRRQLRGLQDQGQPLAERPGKLLHRTPLSRYAFSRAEKLAGEDATVTVLHLLAAILEDETGLSARVVEGSGPQPAILRDALLSDVSQRPPSSSGGVAAPGPASTTHPLSPTPTPFRGIGGIVNVFVSYSHSDSQWIEDQQHGIVAWLERHLTRRNVEFWYDHELRQRPGVAYRDEIRHRINAAHYAVLLLSQEFVASEFIQDLELPLIKERYLGNEIGVIPILVGRVLWEWEQELGWLTDLQILPEKQAPLIDFVSDPARFQQVRLEILAAIQSRMFEELPPRTN